jgi:hypothetical protein
MGLGHSPKVVTDGLVFYYDMGNPLKSWRGAPTFNASLQDGQNDVNPWFGDGTPTPLGIDPTIRFRGRKVAKFRTGSSGNCYINGAAKLSTGTTSTVWTSTFYLKRVDGTALSSVGMYLYVANNTNVNLTVNVTAVEDGWYKAVYTRSGLVAGNPTLTGMFSLGASTEYFFADWQCENLTISTPWVNGTRSNTQALLDVTGNNIITANSLTYASDNTFSFNGSANYVDCGTGGVLTLGNNGSFTASAWVRASTLKNFSGIISKVRNDRGGVYSFMCCVHNNGTLIFYNNAAWYASSNAGITTNTWYNVVFSFNGSTMSYYVNGVAYGTSTLTWPETTAHNVFIGSWYSPNTIYDFNGTIAIAQLYNRALSALEVQQNFNALRGRYGI